jgi:serine/threonine-protein kinase
MEYCPGGDLEGLLAALRWQDKKIPHSLALQIGIELLKALATVHRAQGVRGTSLELVHGDINPSNIFLSIEQSCVKLGDFGVASSCTLGGGLPKGIAAGKLHYLSPEQTQCKAPTAASDLFAVGVVMYEMLVGRRPFMGSSEPEILERIGASRFDPPDLPALFDGFFEKALAKNPKSRFSSAGTFAAELLRIQVDGGLQETPGELGGLIQEALQVLA